MTVTARSEHHTEHGPTKMSSSELLPPTLTSTCANIAGHEAHALHGDGIFALGRDPAASRQLLLLRGGQKLGVRTEPAAMRLLGKTVRMGGAQTPSTSPR